MNEKITIAVKRNLKFETSGETLCVEVMIENVSPDGQMLKKIKPFIDGLYKEAVTLIFEQREETV